MKIWNRLERDDIKMRVYIFGAGNNGILLAAFLRQYNIEVVAFIDNDEKKWGCVFEGIPCMNVGRALEIAKEEIILNSLYDYRELDIQLVQVGFRYVCSVNDFLNRMNYYIPPRMADGDYRSARPFNFYESPFPDAPRIRSQEENLFQADSMILGIDFRWDKQLEHLEEFQKIPLLSWKDNAAEDMRYYYSNGWFSKGCANALYYMLNSLHPRRIIEVGSGFSTAVMIDTNRHCMNNRMEITCIEPNPQRLEGLLRDTDSVCIHKKVVQDIPVDFFEELQSGDILFIDSSHVSKFDSDVNYVFFEILPMIKEGVYIHFHDIFYPFIYPKEWMYAGRPYNEMYLLRAFLMYNPRYSIELFPDMLVKKGAKGAETIFDVVDNYSIWIRKN